MGAWLRCGCLLLRFRPVPGQAAVAAGGYPARFADARAGKPPYPCRSPQKAFPIPFRLDWAARPVSQTTRCTQTRLLVIFFPDFLKLPFPLFLTGPLVCKVGIAFIAVSQVTFY
jgi:hypothetical protein